MDLENAVHHEYDARYVLTSRRDCVPSSPELHHELNELHHGLDDNDAALLDGYYLMLGTPSPRRYSVHSTDSLLRPGREVTSPATPRTLHLHAQDDNSEDESPRVRRRAYGRRLHGTRLHSGPHAARMQSTGNSGRRAHS